MKVSGDTINVGMGKIKVTAIRNPAELPHKALGIDIALECTGLFTAKDKAKAHLEAGAKRVLISAPGESADLTVVFGVNHDKLKTGPSRGLERLLHHELPGAGRQGAERHHRHRARLHDDGAFLYRGPADPRHDAQGSLPRRAASLSQIPTTTGAAKALGLVLPELQGKLDGSAIRVPTPNVSLIDLKIVASRKTSVEEVNAAMKRASEQEMKGVLAVTAAPNVSMDFNHDPHSATFHLDQTKVIDGSFVRVLSWYDNEWGFSNRMADTAVVMGKLI